MLNMLNYLLSILVKIQQSIVMWRMASFIDENDQGSLVSENSNKIKIPQTAFDRVPIPIDIKLRKTKTIDNLIITFPEEIIYSDGSSSKLRVLTNDESQGFLKTKRMQLKMNDIL